MAVGAAGSTLLDPSDYFNAWYKKDGPQNYSGWDNAEFNALLPQIDGEVEPAKRLALIRKAEDIMEREVPVFPICWEKINDVWYDYVKGHNPKDYFGIYDVVRLDTFWLDK
jgi:ABC-type oligopeptide transport system substrate-binding subunit